MEDPSKVQLNQLTDYIMKNCLWQFHSRKWDRERQNEGILTKTKQILLGEEVDLSTPADRCYYADALVLAGDYKNEFPWINDMSKDEIKQLMQEVKERIDYLTITGSLNAELTDPRY